MFEALFSFVRCGHEEPDEVQKEQEAAPSNSSFWNLLRCGTEEPDHWDYDVEEGTESISDHESLQALQDNTRTNETLQAKTSEMINMTPSPSNQHQTDGRRVRFSVQSPSASFPSSHSSSPVSSPSSCLPYLPDTGVRCKSSPPSIPSLKTVHILNGANKENEENEGGNGGKKQQQGKRSGSGRLAVVLREAKPQIRQQITTEGLDYFFTPTPLKYTNPTPYRLKKNKRSNLAPTSTYLTLHEFGHRPDSNNDDKPALYVRCILEETEHTPPICDETSSCMFPRNQEGAKFIQELEEHANAIKKHWKMLRGEPVDSPEKTPESTPGKAEKTLDNEEKEELLLTEPISLSSTPQKPVDQIERNSEEVAIEGMEEEDLKKQGAQVELVHVRRAAIKKGLRKTPTPRKFSSVPDAAVQQGKEEEATEQVTLTPSSLDQERQRKNRPRSRNPRRRSRKKSPHPKTPTGQKTPTEQKTGQAKQDKTKSPWARTHARQRTPKQKTPTEKMVYRQKTRQEEMTRGQENDPVRVLALARVKEALEMVQKQQQQEQQALDRVKNNSNRSNCGTNNNNNNNNNNNISPIDRKGVGVGPAFEKKTTIRDTINKTDMDSK
eukprot:g49122.t1